MCTNKYSNKERYDKVIAKKGAVFYASQCIYANVLNLCFESGHESTLVRVPKNAAVIQGTAVTFQCSSEGMTRSKGFTRILWYNSLCFNDGDLPGCIGNPIYSGSAVEYEFRQRFSVTAVNNRTHKTRDLNINPTRLTDAGVYLCAELRGPDLTSNSSTQLVVLGMNTTHSNT